MVDEQTDAPKSPNGAFRQWNDHRGDLVILIVQHLSPIALDDMLRCA
jgi:hypothetical protein